MPYIYSVLDTPPWVQARCHGRFSCDTAEEFAFQHFGNRFMRLRRTGPGEYNKQYDIARYRVPETHRRAYDQWTAALLKDVKAYVKKTPCTKFPSSQQQRRKLFTHYAILLNFVETYGEFKHHAQDR